VDSSRQASVACDTDQTLNKALRPLVIHEKL